MSAIGNTTNNLIALAEKYSGKNNQNHTELAKLLSTGEVVSSALFSIMLNSMGVPSKSLSAYELEISTFGDPLNSRITYINKKKILECLNSNTVAVVAGFQGVNKNNEITTLGRGGSDTTAVALASIFETEVEIYSDYSGVFSGDPKFLNFKKIKKASFDIMTKMAKAGAKVLDSRAVTLAKDFNTTIISKSSASPNHKGSIISNIECDVVSISEIDHLSKITINFTNKNKMNFIVKNVLLCLNDCKFYNLTINNEEISFLIESPNKIKIMSNLSKKLNLLKK